MKIFRWKNFIITSIVCMLPILIGIILWNKLPESIAIHFNIYGEPDNFASKKVVVFGLPLLMVVLQAVCCFINDINSYKHGDRKKFTTVTEWIIPCMTVVLQLITFGYSIGWNIDIRKAVSFIVGVIFLVTGNYLPKFDYIKNYDINTEKARKINRFLGYETVVMGLIFFVSIFLPPISTLVALIMLIPYAISGVIYGIIIGRRQ